MVDVAIVGESPRSLQRWFLSGLKRVMLAQGYYFDPPSPDTARLILNVVGAPGPRPFHRKSKTTFVVTLAEVDEHPSNTLKAGYPLLIRSLGNVLIFLVRSTQLRVYFITLEQGCYEIVPVDSNEVFFERVLEKLAPLVSSTLIIENQYVEDLPDSVRLGDPIPNQIRAAGIRLDGMGLLPAPFPLEEVLSPRDRRHVRLLFGIGGLSYGNISARATGLDGFWMTATGVDKGRLGEVGRDILLVGGYDLEQRRVILRVSPAVRPRHASVDTIEHALIYDDHPGVGAIVHIHSWMDGVPATSINYPCGTYELACAVSEVIRQVPDPTHAVVGLRNHGLTITGPHLDDILARIDGNLLPSVPLM
jgi:ribulose-5-phosphate 4-epimerase/fuculose-1-phosphate aldolase